MLVPNASLKIIGINRHLCQICSSSINNIGTEKIKHYFTDHLTIGYLQRTVTMCVSTLVSPSAAFLAKQEIVLVLSLAPILMLILELVIQPPSRDTCVTLLEDETRSPSTSQLREEAGLEFDAEH